MIDVQELVDKARDTLTGRRVFAEPIERDGITVVPAAVVAGAGGGGGGRDDSNGGGGGGGFGLQARPAGAYVIDHGQVRWQPAVDVNRVVSAVANVVVVMLFVRWRVAAIRARADRPTEG